MYAFSNGNFYPLSMREIYEKSGSWPNEYIEVDESVFTEFLASPPVGKIRGKGDDGMPAWVDAPPSTPEELIAQAELKRSSLRVQTDSEIDWRQDAVDAGIATEEETTALSEWKKYRVLLMRVDIADPEWPTLPAEQAS